MVICENVLYTKAAAGQLCKALVLRLVTNPLVIHFAKNAGFDVLWVKMEHSTFSITEASNLASAGMMVGLTPIVRVPYQCGMGYVQQVLDSGAMAVVFPHIISAAEAQAAVKMCKFPPLGKRSLWLQQASVGLQAMPMQKMAEEINAQASAVGVMIEATESIINVDAIAAVDGVDLLIVGCIDLSADMGIPGMIDAPKFRAALEAVSAACRRHKKVFGLAGNYTDLNFQDWVINTLGVRLFLSQVDSNLISVGAKESVARMVSVKDSTNGVNVIGTSHIKANLNGESMNGVGINGASVNGSSINSNGIRVTGAFLSN